MKNSTYNFAMLFLTAFVILFIIRVIFEDIFTDQKTITNVWLCLALVCQVSFITTVAVGAVQHFKKQQSK